MKRRTFEEMISYFNQTVSDMDIDRKYKMTLLGIVTALLQKHDEDVALIVRCKDCKHRIEHKHYGDFGESAYTCEGNMVGMILPDDFCSRAERRTDDLQ